MLVLLLDCKALVRWNALLTDRNTRFTQNPMTTWYICIYVLGGREIKRFIGPCIAEYVCVRVEQMAPLGYLARDIF